MADSTAEQQPTNPPIDQAIIEINKRVRVEGKFVSNNPLGRPPRMWSTPVKRQEFRRSMLRLIQVRDGRIQELDFDQRGKKVAVVPSVQNLIKACELILAYAAGKPAQKIDIDIAGDSERPNTLQIVLNRPATKEQRTEASKQIIELANVVEDDKDK